MPTSREKMEEEKSRARAANGLFLLLLGTRDSETLSCAAKEDVDVDAVLSSSAEIRERLDRLSAERDRERETSARAKLRLTRSRSQAEEGSAGANRILTCADAQRALVRAGRAEAAAAPAASAGGDCGEGDSESARYLRDLAATLLGTVEEKERAAELEIAKAKYVVICEKKTAKPICFLFDLF